MKLTEILLDQKISFGKAEAASIRANQSRKDHKFFSEQLNQIFLDNNN